jgi:hypothetical protein
MIKFKDVREVAANMTFLTFIVFCMALGSTMSMCGQFLDDISVRRANAATQPPLK